MIKHNKEISSIQQQYLGYTNTPALWENASIHNLQQFADLKHVSIPNLVTDTKIPTRLGKRIEHFVFNDIAQNSNLNLLAENLQIQQDNQTIGELDALLLVNQQPVHLEIIYKFYLYDPQLGPQELNCWIGPNRNDSLIKKLDKLKHKQFPLLHHAETKTYLDKLHLKISDIEQQVLFKAQLFVPKAFDKGFKFINNACVLGKYYTKTELFSLADCKFHLPEKLNWLIINIPHKTPWLDLHSFSDGLETQLQLHRAPLIWIKHPQGVIERAFVVWW